MKIVIISDTHKEHCAFARLEGDVLIHCGDMFNLSDVHESNIEAMDRWFGEQDFDVVLCTGGNHDRPLEMVLRDNPQPFQNAIYLQDASYIHNGTMFWGAPWVPYLSGHAFFATGQQLAKKWSMIPAEVDVLITHTPPRSILDISSHGFELGCDDLLDAVHRIRPKVHCFGHVHHSRGQIQDRGTLFLNASSIRRGVSGVLEPIVVEL